MGPSEHPWAPGLLLMGSACSLQLLLPRGEQRPPSSCWQEEPGDTGNDLTQEPGQLVSSFLPLAAGSKHHAWKDSLERDR